MKRKGTLLVLGLAASATVAMAQPAAAQPLCFGPSRTYVCIDPTGGDPIQECIFAGPPPCHPVSVPTPVIWCGGNLSCDGT